MTQSSMLSFRLSIRSFVPFMRICVLLGIRKEFSHLMKRKSIWRPAKKKFCVFIFFFAFDAEKLDVRMEGYMLFHSKCRENLYILQLRSESKRPSTWVCVCVWEWVSVAIHSIITLLLWLLWSSIWKKFCCNLKYRTTDRVRVQTAHMTAGYIYTSLYRSVSAWWFLVFQIPRMILLHVYGFKPLYPYLDHNHRVWITHYIYVKEKWFIISHSNADTHTHSLTLTPQLKNHSKICCCSL